MLNHWLGVCDLVLASYNRLSLIGCTCNVYMFTWRYNCAGSVQTLCDPSIACASLKSLPFDIGPGPPVKPPTKEILRGLEMGRVQ